MRALVYPPDRLLSSEPPSLSDFGRRILAEGDSWFTIGTFNMSSASNVLFKLELTRSTAIVNCAYPGQTLQHMVDRVNDPYFDRLLRSRRHSRFWEAILVSAGGNDLIDAAEVQPFKKNGSPVDPADRLFLTASEFANYSGDPNDPRRFLSLLGWQKLEDYLAANFAELVDRRDQGRSVGRPIMLHTYASPVVRPAGSVGSPRGWLYPSLERYGIVDADAQNLSDLIFEKLRSFLLGLDCRSQGGLPGVFVFDSAGISDLVAADQASDGSSGDWVNEIHLTPKGYEKIGKKMGPWIEEILASYYPS